MPFKAKIGMCGVASAKKYALSALHHIFVRGNKRRKIFLMMPTLMIFWTGLAAFCQAVRLPVLHWRL
jgi:hypothetical protein